jgi:hypothetical protein
MLLAVLEATMVEMPQLLSVGAQAGSRVSPGR